MKDLAKGLLGWVRGYLSGNRSVFFILGFLFLLIAAAGLLVFGLEAMAEGVSLAAYFSLLVGVIIQFIGVRSVSKAEE